MEPTWYSFSFSTPEGVRIVQVEGLGRYDVQDAAFEATFKDGVYELSVVAAGPLHLMECQIGFVHHFGEKDGLLLNGYQSWTTTEWLTPNDTMRGLDLIPEKIVKRYALNASGDYRIISYARKPGQLHGFSYAVFRSEDAFTLVGGLQEQKGFTVIRTDCAAGHVMLEPECPARVLQGGEKVVVCRVAIVQEQTEDAAYDRWFALAGITARRAKPLCGYTSWYRHYENIDEAKILTDLAGAVQTFADYRDDDVIRLFQIDDGWCKKGDWLTPDPQRFPDGMEPVAKAIRSVGFLPGLWIAPFVAEKDSTLVAEHPDWLLRDRAGHLVSTGSHWSGHYALNTTNADVRAYVSECVRRAVYEWGFGLLKVDFLYAACMEVHDDLNRGQLMADAWRLVREAAGNKTPLLACGVPLASVFGSADYCRIGCDVGLDWDDKPHMRLLHRERVSTKKSLGDTIARAPLDGRAFGCDPDVVFLRPNVKLSRSQRERMLKTAANYGSVLLTSDDMGSWSDGQRAAYAGALQEVVARYRKRTENA